MIAPNQKNQSVDNSPKMRYRPSMQNLEGTLLPKEIERRFLVKRLAKKLPKPNRKINIAQGWIDTGHIGRSLRIRICDDQEAFLAIKLGSGLVRNEIQSDLNLELAKLMMKDCQHHLKKERWVINGWELDFYKAPLKGVVTAEKELNSPKEKLKIPSWLEEVTEITETLTSRDLGCIATALRENKNSNPQKAVRKLLKQRS